ncbi:putative sulfate exporter family transporter [uncultured Methanobrevibacter sp.]|mgnify:CR=1 FL=1|uniref:YeiH family protein n=1 Tax=uncultured Methanobrevibacter sp. TaxID=253161 RepID=UPI002632CFE0
MILNKEIILGLIICFLLAIPSFLLGNLFPIIGGPIIAIILGMIIAIFWKDKGRAEEGIGFTSKYILQLAVVFLGFGLNLTVIVQTGIQSLPIIIGTISIALIIAYLMMKALKMERNSAILIGVGSSICGGSAIAATAPIIGAKNEEVAQSISIIFFFNVIAAIIFPFLGRILGFSTVDGEAFGIFAGTAINDTSSVTAAAATWDNMWGLGSQTLDKAATVKLTRTLAIIPITLALSYIIGKKEEVKNNMGLDNREGFSLKRAFPTFIAFFILASLITTITVAFGADPNLFVPLKEISKFLIVMAMLAIGLNSDIVKLVKSGGKPLLLGASCWISITIVSLLLQHLLGIW